MLLVFGGSTTHIMDGSRHRYLRAVVRCLVTELECLLVARSGRLAHVALESVVHPKADIPARMSVVGVKADSLVRSVLGPF